MKKANSGKIGEVGKNNIVPIVLAQQIITSKYIIRTALRPALISQVGWTCNADKDISRIFIYLLQFAYKRRLNYGTSIIGAHYGQEVFATTMTGPRNYMHVFCFSHTWFIDDLNTMFIRCKHIQYVYNMYIYTRTYKHFHEYCSFSWSPHCPFSTVCISQPPLLLTWRSLFWWSWCEYLSTLVPG